MSDAYGTERAVSNVPTGLPRCRREIPGLASWAIFKPSLRDFRDAAMHSQDWRPGLFSGCPYGTFVPPAVSFNRSENVQNPGRRLSSLRGSTGKEAFAKRKSQAKNRETDTLFKLPKSESAPVFRHFFIQECVPSEPYSLASTKNDKKILGYLRNQLKTHDLASAKTAGF